MWASVDFILKATVSMLPQQHFIKTIQQHLPLSVRAVFISMVTKDRQWLRSISQRYRVIIWLCHLTDESPLKPLMHVWWDHAIIMSCLEWHRWYTAYRYKLLITHFTAIQCSPFRYQGFKMHRCELLGVLEHAYCAVVVTLCTILIAMEYKTHDCTYCCLHTCLCARICNS